MSRPEGILPSRCGCSQSQRGSQGQGQTDRKKEGKYGSEQVKPHKPTEEDIEEKSWIEIELVDEEDNPVPGEKYKITLPDGSVAQGTLDNEGFARVEGIDPGTCKITFPNLDKEAWEKIETAKAEL